MPDSANYRHICLKEYPKDYQVTLHSGYRAKEKKQEFIIIDTKNPSQVN